MRTAPFLAALVLVGVSAGDVSAGRRGTFPESVYGIWAATADACAGPGESKLSISAKKYVSDKFDCEVDWIMVTPGRGGANYSVRSRCVDRATGQPRPPTELIVRVTDQGELLVGADMAHGKSFQRCPADDTGVAANKPKDE